MATGVGEIVELVHQSNRNSMERDYGGRVTVGVLSITEIR